MSHGSGATSSPRRINVALTADEPAALNRVIRREHVTRTEAVRRLLRYGDVLYRATKQDGARIILRTDNLGEREVHLL